MRKQLTLCLIHQHPRLLLGMKKRGFGAGRWNGFGGKVERGETIEAAARRELFEEVGIDAVNLDTIGVLEFSFENDPDILEVHVFRVEGFSGEPKESEEMCPQWFHTDRIPFNDMWPDDVHWFPLFLRGSRFRGQFHFKDVDTILKWDLVEL